MQLAVVNKRAARKYDELVGAMGTVWAVLEEARSVVAQIDPNAPAAYPWLPTSEELALHLRKAEEHMEALEKRARRYKAELISQEWRI
jgi:hypothetical protein